MPKVIPTGPLAARGLNTRAQRTQKHIHTRSRRTLGSSNPLVACKADNKGSSTKVVSSGLHSIVEKTANAQDESNVEAMILSGETPRGGPVLLAHAEDIPSGPLTTNPPITDPTIKDLERQLQFMNNSLSRMEDERKLLNERLAELEGELEEKHVMIETLEKSKLQHYRPRALHWRYHILMLYLRLRLSRWVKITVVRKSDLMIDDLGFGRPKPQTVEAMLAPLKEELIDCPLGTISAQVGGEEAQYRVRSMQVGFPMRILAMESIAFDKLHLQQRRASFLLHIPPLVNPGPDWGGLSPSPLSYLSSKVQIKNVNFSIA
ncbi:hypothetical protein BKA70DRAFT_1232289 [Coprinopsis sp. MPI-PUGE-AT-0042]|nr:hypothetical protein BKA70DRAFT_1232289 [Coprinopsis sp. MPI-PUGE-AT-0042]